MFTKQDIDDINVTLQITNDNLVKTIFEKSQLVSTLDTEIFRLKLENTNLKLEIKELKETINKLQTNDKKINTDKDTTNYVYFNYLTSYFRK